MMLMKMRAGNDSQLEVAARLICLLITLCSAELQMQHHHLHLMYCCCFRMLLGVLFTAEIQVFNSNCYLLRATTQGNLVPANQLLNLSRINPSLKAIYRHHFCSSYLMS